MGWGATDVWCAVEEGKGYNNSLSVSLWLSKLVGGKGCCENQ